MLCADRHGNIEGHWGTNPGRDPRQAVSLTDNTTPLNINTPVDSRDTGVPIPGREPRQAVLRTTLQLNEPHALTITKTAQLRSENLPFIRALHIIHA